MKKPLKSIAHIDSLSIMIIDDEPVLSYLLSTLLQKMGHTTEEYEQSIIGIHEYRKKWKNIDLIILDLSMPLISGKDTYIQLKKINPEVNVIITSGNHYNNEIRELTSMGISNFLLKPYEIDTLVKTIKSAIAPVIHYDVITKQKESQTLRSY